MEKEKLVESIEDLNKQKDKRIKSLEGALTSIPGIDADYLMQKDEPTGCRDLFILRFRDVLTLNTFLWAGSFRFFSLFKNPGIALQINYADVSPVDTNIKLILSVSSEDYVQEELIKNIQEFIHWYTSLDGLLARATW